ncbi:GTPase-activating protein [Saccharomycopsis crataegensis]|uniref:GTPase-activating protein n=1 Tax=Saccharomycopsis crataegensis TaxID=43959 RepID=A0AAV5QSK8_9ASCO|nr:GTPase-activating protein [Saccharomycopsis crataegensis]
MTLISNSHESSIHDAALDYYGKRLATCSSDQTIKIFEIEGETHKLVDTLKQHDGAVWQVSWAHPKFGVILASASFDGKVIIWREENGKWKSLLEHTVHKASVNSVEWAPHEYGAVLLCASSDGQVSIFEVKENGTTHNVVFPAHEAGVNSASWAPVSTNKTGTTITSPTEPSEPLKRFVTGGCDNLVKVWNWDSVNNKATLESTLEGHADWVRDVAWSSSVLFKSYIASSSLDKSVIIWTQENNKGPWKKQYLTKDKFAEATWKVSWSLSGNILAVSSADNKITLWKENLSGEWESAGEVDQ